MKGFDKASMVRRNKLINNLPRYDLGTTPINRGYQSASNSIPSPFVSLAGQNLSLMVSGLKLANAALLANSGAQLATQATGIVDIGKQLKDGAFGNAGSLAAKGTAAGLNIVATIPSAMQLYGAINTKGSFDGLGGNDLDMLASKNTEYRNGVAYENIGGVDSNNIMKAARAREFGENTNLTTSAIGTGAGVGATIGSFFPGAGNLIGAGIGALVGGLGSLFGWNNDEVKEQRRRLQNWRIASSAANTQNEAVAGSTGLRNEFYATHADQGLSPHRGKKNALVGGGEVITKHDSNGNVIDAVMEPVTQYTPERADVIPVHLNNNNGVLGNKINPLTGNRFAVDARYNINNPDALTQLVAIQDMVTNKNRIKKYDQGKYMGLLSMLPGIMEMGVGAKQAHSYAKDPVVSYNPYTANNNAAIAADELARLHYNPYPMLNSLRESDRQAIYNMNTASLSPAQRLAMLSTYYNNGMKNKADVLASGLQLENQYRAAHANLLAQLGEQDATRRQQGNAAYHESLSRARAAQRKGIETGWQTGLKGINTTIGNYLNNYWTNRNIGLYEQAYKTPPVDILAMNEEMSNAFKTPSKEQTIKQLQKPNGILTRDIKSGNGYDDVVNQWERDYALRSVLPSVPRITGEDIVLREPNTPAGAEKRTISGLPKLEGNELEPFWSRRPELEYYELPDGTHTYHRPSRMPILYRDYEPNAWDMLQKSGKFKHLNETLFNDLTGIDWSNVPLAILKDLPMYKYRNVTGVDWSNPKFKLKRSNK